MPLVISLPSVLIDMRHVARCPQPPFVGQQ